MSRWDDEPITCGVILVAALVCTYLATSWGVIVTAKRRTEGDGSAWKGHCLTMAVALTLTVLTAIGAAGYALWSVAT